MRTASARSRPAEYGHRAGRLLSLERLIGGHSPEVSELLKGAARDLLELADWQSRARPFLIAQESPDRPGLRAELGALLADRPEAAR